MQQLLPEVVNIFERLNEKKSTEIIPINRDWEYFISFVNSIDIQFEKEKKNILNKVPRYLKKSVADAISSKKTNDRAFNAYLAIFCLGKDPNEYLDILPALEFLDSAVVIVDDVFDQAESRANKAPHYKKWGINLSISTAFYLTSFSTMIILDSKLKEHIKSQIIKEMESYHSEIYKGQYIDLDNDNKAIDTISFHDYKKMIKLTTGYQIAGSFKVGGFIAGARSQKISILSELGILLGVIGQIRDDLVDYFPNEKEIWKTPLLDFRMNKRRLPLLVAWGNLSASERNIILDLQNKKRLTMADHAIILKLIFKPDNLQIINSMMLTVKKRGYGLIEKGSFTSNGTKLLKSYFSYGIGSYK